MWDIIRLNLRVHRSYRTHWSDRSPGGFSVAISMWLEFALRGVSVTWGCWSWSWFWTWLITRWLRIARGARVVARRLRVSWWTWLVYRRLRVSWWTWLVYRRFRLSLRGSHFWASYRWRRQYLRRHLRDSWKSLIFDFSRSQFFKGFWI